MRSTSGSGWFDTGADDAPTPMSPATAVPPGAAPTAATNTRSLNLVILIARSPEQVSDEADDRRGAVLEPAEETLHGVGGLLRLGDCVEQHHRDPDQDHGLLGVHQITGSRPCSAARR